MSFSFTLLQQFLFHNEGGGTPLCHLLVPISPKFRRFFSVQPLASSLQPPIPFLATHPKTQVLKVMCLPHIQKMTGVGVVC
jgi:hypothetical protein